MKAKCILLLYREVGDLEGCFTNMSSIKSFLKENDKISATEQLKVISTGKYTFTVEIKEKGLLGRSYVKNYYVSEMELNPKTPPYKI